MTKGPSATIKDGVGVGGAGAPTPEDAQAMEAYLAHLRHEFRTPVNAIIGYSELLLEDLEDLDRPHFTADLKKVLAGGREVLSLIDEIIDPQKIKSRVDAEREDYKVELLHALRTPINTITGYTEMLMEEAGEGELKHMVEDLEKVLTGAQNLLALLNDIVSLPEVSQRKAPPPEKAKASRDTLRAIATIPPLHDAATMAHRELTGTVLVVDDNATNRQLLKRRLKRNGHQVSEAENGVDALEVLQKRHFDLILLDIIMPEMNGYEVLRRLKKDEELRHIPVIMITSLADVESLVACIEIGADDYLTKPFDPVILQARIGACLEKKHLRDREQAHLEQIRLEREKSERLLLNILPGPIAERLKKSEQIIVDTFPDVTVIFSDLVGFTELTTILDPQNLIKLLNTIFSSFDRLAEKHRMEKIKTIGDAYMAVAGLIVPRPDHAVAAAELALDMMREIRRISEQEGRDLKLRVGINTGPVIAGVIGKSKFIYDLWGDTVNTASRMESHSRVDEIQVSGSTYEHLREQFTFEARGEIEVKGKGMMETYMLQGKI